MKKVLLPFLILVFSTVVFSQKARLQVIHNSADPDADTIDIYANGELFLDDFAFRTATPYRDVDANVNIRLAVAPKESNRSEGRGVQDTIQATGQTINLTGGGTFAAVATGLLSSATQNNLSFRIIPTEGSETTTDPYVGLKYFHGVTDAPAVDISVRNALTVVSGLAYGHFSSAYELAPPAEFLVDVTASGTSDTLVSYNVDLTAHSGMSGIVLVSGFLSPQGNEESFGLVVILADGKVLTFQPLVTGLPGSDVKSGPLELYPIPASEYVYLKKTGVKAVQISDLSGNLIKIIHHPSGKIDINDIKTGLYTATIIYDTYSETAKICVNR